MTDFFNETVLKFDYRVKNQILAFSRGPLSNFYGGYKNQGRQPQFKDPWGQEYICSEQFYMNEKALFFKDKETSAKILAATNPREHQQLGQQVAGFDKEEWNDFKQNAMFEGLFYKFTQNEDLAEFLLSTGDLILAEAADWDLEWGTGYTHLQDECFDQSKWKGKNLLGVELMRIREYLKNPLDNKL